MSDPTAASRGRRSFSYRWVILATGFGIMVLSSGLNRSFGVFVRTLIEARHPVMRRSRNSRARTC